jgi:hypothetical protein
MTEFSMEKIIKTTNDKAEFIICLFCKKIKKGINPIIIETTSQIILSDGFLSQIFIYDAFTTICIESIASVV